MKFKKTFLACLLSLSASSLSLHSQGEIQHYYVNTLSAQGDGYPHVSLVQGFATRTVESQPSNSYARLAESSFGVNAVGRFPDLFFGEVIAPPDIAPNGDPVDGLAFYDPKPANISNPADPETDRFYYSPHSEKVYATSAGTVSIEWVERGNPGNTRTVSFRVSGSPIKDPVTIYWNQIAKSFNGPLVSVPGELIKEVKVVFGTLFPETVATEQNGDTSSGAELRTLWYDQLGANGVINAYNAEGRVFIEYLGNLKENGQREHLGYEIVKVIREARSIPKNVFIGERILPFNFDVASLEAVPESLKSVSDGNAGDSFFLYRQQLENEEFTAFYAIKETVDSQEVRVFWKQRSLLGILWPAQYIGYQQTWPEVTPDNYSFYIQDFDADTNPRVQIPGENNPIILYENRPHALLDSQFYFSAAREGYSLILHKNVSDFWLERVATFDESEYVELANSFGYPALTGESLPDIERDIGLSVLVPGDDPLIDTSITAYINPAKGTAYNVNTYINPYNEEGIEFSRSRVFGINNNPAYGGDQLQLWWSYRSEPETGNTLSGYYWPSTLRNYNLSWPTSPDKIILASNEGSGELTSLQANATIYFQNDPEVHGFNPNEEHALMAAGRAYAIRDDLNYEENAPFAIKYSEPYVLTDYADAEGFPKMQVFKVEREDLANGIIFDYSVTAGKILQSVMPLPLLPLPRDVNDKVLNIETTLLSDNATDTMGFSPSTDGRYVHYGKYTWEDRKGAKWIYRARHDGDPATIRMDYYYPTQEGFYFPHLAHDSQPVAGTNVPYLRAFTNGTDATSGFVGTPVDLSPDVPLDIIFRPSWPTGVAELRAGETLTSAKYGLPTIRGQLSAQVLYEQSVGKDATDEVAIDDFTQRKWRSALLTDPTRAKMIALDADTNDAGDEPDLKSEGSISLPNSIATQQSGLKIYFEQLPPHLVERVYVDLTRGDYGTLVLEGEFVDAPTGEDYLMLNTLTDTDLQTIKDLVTDTSDPRKTGWGQIVDALSTTVELFVENPSVAGTYTPVPFTSSTSGNYSNFSNTNYINSTLTPSYSLTAAQWGSLLPSDKSNTTFQSSYGVQDIVEIAYEEVPADSLALTAIGNGLGYVTLVFNNSRALVSEEEPVSMSIIRVTDPIYRGELKVIASDNPLAEKLTLQHTGDFAAQADNYEFEWKYAPPVDGLPIPVYTYDYSTLLVEGALWDQKYLSNQYPITSFDDTDNQTEALNYRSLDYYTPVNLSSWNSVALDTGALKVKDVTVEVPADVDEVLPLRAQSILSNRFTAPNDIYEQVLLSLDMNPDIEGAVIFLNGAEVARIGQVPGDTTAQSSAESSYSPLGTTFALPGRVVIPGADNLLIVELYSGATVQNSDMTPSDFNLKLEAKRLVDSTDRYISLGAAETGKVRHVIEGASILTLSDNYLTMRYRPANNKVSLYTESGGNTSEWSKWTEPQLAEGWVKRALGGINPFEQRTKDFLNNEIDATSSILVQAGKRWEGDIPLNLDNINDFGLIEIYETIFKRAMSLSIDGAPPIDYGPANDALLLVAGYLGDLYKIIADDAYADAQDPTIAFSLNSGEVGAVSTTSMFSFLGQVPDLIDEELVLLRGRDDRLLPSVQIPPFYNRFIWNYTNGIASGEVVYALNYNISEDRDDDGFINELDAAVQYPQGHGDAWGHYLTAIKFYYRLLTDQEFTWVPRIEAVLVAGTPVSVDYMDERKFAALSEARSRAGLSILDLTYRKAYTDASSQKYDGMIEETLNDRTGRTRHWGVDQWGSRIGQGTYFDWVVGNSLIPEVDPDPTHEGIQKIDRTTVLELAQLPLNAIAAQQYLDNSNAHLNPLGIARDAVNFDLNGYTLDDAVIGVTEGNTHFEQVFQRAVTAINNADLIFDNAQESTLRIREQFDAAVEYAGIVEDTERDFKAQLIEIYGRPYPDDIGPGKLYPQGYDGPDLYRYYYVDLPVLFSLAEETQTFNIYEFQLNEDRAVSDILYDPDVLESVINLRFQSDVETAVRTYLESNTTFSDASNDKYSYGLHPEYYWPPYYYVGSEPPQPNDVFQGAESEPESSDDPSYLRRLVGYYASKYYMDDHLKNNFSQINAQLGLNTTDYNSYLSANFEEGDPLPLFVKIHDPYVLESPFGKYKKPDHYTGQRPYTGALQEAIIDLAKEFTDLEGDISDYQYTNSVIKRSQDLFRSMLSTERDVRDIENDGWNLSKKLLRAQSALEGLIAASETAREILGMVLDPKRKKVGVTGAGTTVVFDGEPVEHVIEEAVGTPIHIGLMVAETAAQISNLVMGVESEINDWETARDADVRAFEYERDAAAFEIQNSFYDAVDQQGVIRIQEMSYTQALADVRTLITEGQRIQEEREIFRKQAAGDVQKFRTSEMAFRLFRNSALRQYKEAFDLAQRYAYMAAKAFDYETGLLDSENSVSSASFLEQIVEARAIGELSDGGEPVVGIGDGTDNSLSDVLARMRGDWSILRTQLGINSPKLENNSFSLRRELFRILDGAEGDEVWQAVLTQSRMSNILDDPDVYALAKRFDNMDPAGEPGIVITFGSEVSNSRNFFGLSLSGGDSAFNGSSYSHKIQYAGVVLEDYPGDIFGSSTGTGNLLSSTPQVYLIPAGIDRMRVPDLSTGLEDRVRSWNVVDQLMPLPYDIAGLYSEDSSDWVTGDSLQGTFTQIRRFPTFKAVASDSVFSNFDPEFVSPRLAGRSVWNTRWKLVIPASTLLSDREEALRRFIENVSDIKVYLETYSYGGF